MITKIYGASDDLIEIEGAVSDEANIYLNGDEYSTFELSDGTSGTIKYDGEWKFEVEEVGSKFKAKISSVGDDSEHRGIAEGCTSYSDVLIFDEGIEWVQIGKEVFK